MKVSLLFGWLLFALTSQVLAQDRITLMRYYDLEKTQLKEQLELHPLDSSLDGKYQVFYQSGKVMTEGTYSQNQPNGSWIYYYESGKKKAEGVLKEGLQNGNWEYYYESGIKKTSGLFLDGKKEGKWITYYENGQIKSSGFYTQNTKNDLWSYFTEDASIKAQALYENGIGAYKEFYSSGMLRAEGTISGEVSQGEWKYYHESGALESTGQVVDGERSGYWEFFYPNEQLAAYGYYTQGVKTGEWNYFHSNGQISAKGSLSEGKKDGDWYLFYDSGEPAGLEKLKMGTGEVINYHPNGNVLSRGMLINGLKQGLWEYFNEIGEKEGSAIFNKDEGQYIGYHANGSVKMTGKIQKDRKVGVWELFDESGNKKGTFRPVYEDEQPFYKLTPEKPKPVADLSQYKYKKKTNRFFNSRINEYRGFVLESNPLFTLAGVLPVSIEYYLQERLGYVFRLHWYRSPFFTKEENIDLSEMYRMGIAVELMQKYYFKEKDLGMFYFGQSLTFSQRFYKARVLDPSSGSGIPSVIQQKENLSSYGVLSGWRWMQNAGGKGLTFDAYVGAGIGIRRMQNNFEPNPDLDVLFESVKTKPIAFPIQVGILMGWSIPKPKKKKK